jgi:DNA-binding Lrp family transcriptional regulator
LRSDGDFAWAQSHAWSPLASDRGILDELQRNGRMPNTELAEAVNLSPSPCLARVKRLEREAVIARYVALLNPPAVGLGVSVFVQVRLERQAEASLNKFERRWPDARK